jgi:hypothetical protein
VCHRLPDAQQRGRERDGRRKITVVEQDEDVRRSVGGGSHAVPQVGEERCHERVVRIPAHRGIRAPGLHAELDADRFRIELQALALVAEPVQGVLAPVESASPPGHPQPCDDGLGDVVRHRWCDAVRAGRRDVRRHRTHRVDQVADEAFEQMAVAVLVGAPPQFPCRRGGIEVVDPRRDGDVGEQHPFERRRVSGCTGAQAEHDGGEQRTYRAVLVPGNPVRTDRCHGRAPVPRGVNLFQQCGTAGASTPLDDEHRTGIAAAVRGERRQPIDRREQFGSSDEDHPGSPQASSVACA